MDYTAVYVDSCSHVDHSSWRLDVHNLPESFTSCGVFNIHGQHIPRYVFHDEHDKLHHDYCNHIVSGANTSFVVNAMLTCLVMGLCWQLSCHDAIHQQDFPFTEADLQA